MIDFSSMFFIEITIENVVHGLIFLVIMLCFIKIKKVNVHLAFINGTNGKKI